ncbi:helix-turn-helix transcriptional regulator [Devosia sp. UYZn731]|uniref:helix-turn-helix transcriptional regulator n=1 Tax=Devosia sp. UYZn731 TaxID=3156345 RepID=UPI00339A3735
MPELWPEVLGHIAKMSNAHSGALLIIDPKLPPLFAATPNVIDTLAEFARTPYWYENPPAHRLRSIKYSGFLERADFFTHDEINSDNPYHANMEKIGAAWQVGSVIDMPDGEMALFTFERGHGLPDFDAGELARLDTFRPHLARASMLASRLKLDRAQASVATMNVLGIPACVVAATGVVLAVNRLFEALGEALRPAAFGRLAARDRHIDKLLQAALPGPGQTSQPEVRSFPMRRSEGDPAIVVHIIPLHRSASDIFDSGAAIVAVTGYSVTGNLPSDTVLRGLFDLSVAEAGIATELSAGKTVKEIALLRGVSLATVRTHLAQIFRKTGTNQQGQLIALLKGISGHSED